jgi:hypothetical protein
MTQEGPTSQYQCVSRPGNCKFEWCCGPLCACSINGKPRTEQEKKDVKAARIRQANMRYRMKLALKRRKRTRRDKDAVALAVLWSMADSRRHVGWLGRVYDAVCGLGYHTMAEVDEMVRSHGFIVR